MMLKTSEIRPKMAHFATINGDLFASNFVSFG